MLKAIKKTNKGITLKKELFAVGIIICMLGSAMMIGFSNMNNQKVVSVNGNFLTLNNGDVICGFKFARLYVNETKYIQFNGFPEIYKVNSTTINPLSFESNGVKICYDNKCESYSVIAYDCNNMCYYFPERNGVMKDNNCVTENETMTLQSYIGVAVK